jgi:hypothetical protein
VACLLFAVSGYRQGFVVGVLSFVGFLGGGVLGAQLAPSVAGSQFFSQFPRTVVGLGRRLPAGQPRPGAGHRSSAARPQAAHLAAGPPGRRRRGAVISVVSLLLVSLAGRAAPWRARRTPTSRRR